MHYLYRTNVYRDSPLRVAIRSPAQSIDEICRHTWPNCIRRSSLVECTFHHFTRDATFTFQRHSANLCRNGGSKEINKNLYRDVENVSTFQKHSRFAFKELRVETNPGWRKFSRASAYILTSIVTCENCSAVFLRLFRYAEIFPYYLFGEINPLYGENFLRDIFVKYLLFRDFNLNERYLFENCNYGSECKKNVSLKYARQFPCLPMHTWIY